MKYSSSLVRFSTALGATFCAAQLFAQVSIVDFGSSLNYVTATTGLQGHTSTGKAFDLTTPYSPATGYSAPTGKSGTFYGASAITQSLNGTGSWGTTGGARITNDQIGTPNYGSDTLSFFPSWTGTSGDSAQRFNFIAAFKKSDFLNGGNSGTVSFDAASTFSVSYNASTGYHNPRLRILVQDGANWFISSAYAPAANNTIVNTLNVSFISGRTWESYDPTGTLSSLSGITVTPTFADVNAVGIWWQVGSLAGNNGGTNGRTHFGSFKVDNALVTAIPEPSSIALLAGAACLLGVVLKRRRS